MAVNALCWAKAQLIALTKQKWRQNEHRGGAEQHSSAKTATSSRLPLGLQCYLGLPFPSLISANSTRHIRRASHGVRALPAAQGLQSNSGPS